MKIIFLTQYFPPEIGAPQNRLFELAVLLKKNIDITILTAMPNYPGMEIHEKYKRKLYYYEELNGLKIHRSYIFASKKSNILFRLLNYFSFVVSSIIIGSFKLNKSDFLFCESPPLFLGISAYFLCKIKRAKLIFNVSDLWPESAEKLNVISNTFLLNQATKLEEFLYDKSCFITGQTQGIVANISKRFPQKDVYWLPNGVDLNYYNYDKISTKWKEENGFSTDDYILIYAGIIGLAQGLEIILYAAEKLLSYPRIKFVLMGSGPEKQKLEQLKAELQLSNVCFFDPVGKSEMPEVLKAIDATIIPLKKLDLFKGAIPSKIFENLAMRVPIILGVEGEAKDLFIDEGKCGLFFEPENYLELTDKILILYKDKKLSIELGSNGEKYVSSKFSREKIATEFLDKINKLNT